VASAPRKKETLAGQTGKPLPLVAARSAVVLCRRIFQCKSPARTKRQITKRTSTGPTSSRKDAEIHTAEAQMNLSWPRQFHCCHAFSSFNSRTTRSNPASCCRPQPRVSPTGSQSQYRDIAQVIDWVSVKQITFAVRALPRETRFGVSGCLWRDCLECRPCGPVGGLRHFGYF